MQVVTNGGVSFASGLKMYGAQILAKKDVTFTAEADGLEGASIIACGQIDGTSNAAMAFCGSGLEGNFELPYFRMSL